tara:strand:- start:986 stop:2074 length:1089 start_codon:yes stop_codon:yes gene_type:complete
MKDTFELFVKHFENSIGRTGKNIQHLNFDRLYEKDLLKIKETIGGDRGHVILLLDEPHFYNPGSLISKQWLDFKEILLKYQIFNCDFYAPFWLSDPNIDSFNYLNKNFYDWRFHSIGIDLFKFDKKIADIKISENYDFEMHNCTMKLSHLNFTHRMHRQLFSKFLIKENICENNLMAINGHRRDVQKKKNYLHSSNRLIPIQQNDGWFYDKKLLDLWQDVPLKHIKHACIDDNYDEPYMEFLKKAAFNIVSETVFDFPFPDLSEKTMQPILAKRPFIMIGAYGNLRCLRSGGFKTFDSVIDESYDEIEDPNKRMHAVMRLVLELNKMGQTELNDMLYGLEDVLLHNFHLLKKKIEHFTNEPK